MVTYFSQDNFHHLCNQLAERDTDLAAILSDYGYPPYWSRPNNFETLVHIILEQQVSLASALSALNRLKSRLGDIGPEAVLSLSDEQMRECYCSRQKTGYIRHLANELLCDRLNLLALEPMEDEQVRARLLQLKGIGNWTADVYLMFVLHRTDVFPVGDLAAVNALKQVKNLAAVAGKDQLINAVEMWQPYRTIATMILWHYYLSYRKPKLISL